MKFLLIVQLKSGQHKYVGPFNQEHGARAYYGAYKNSDDAVSNLYEIVPLVEPYYNPA